MIHSLYRNAIGALTMSCAVLLTPATPAAEPTADAAGDSLLAVVIVLRDQPDAADLQALTMDGGRATRRSIVEHLQLHARHTQRPILDRLDAAAAQGQADRVRPLWLANVIAARVTLDLAHQLARRDDVAMVLRESFINDAEFRTNSRDGDAPMSLGDVTCGLEQIGAPRAWNQMKITGEGVVIAVIGTGACIEHPDLRGRVWTNEGEIPGNNIDDDDNGYVDDVHGWNFAADSADVSDPNGLGTHVAGTAVGDGSGGTNTGVAPGAQFMPLVFLNNLGGETSVWLAMEYAVANGAHVINGSLGWPHSAQPARAIWRAVCENALAAGVTLVYSAGGDGACCRPYDAIRTPGDVPGVITVGTTDCNDVIASFSSRGPVTWQDVPQYNDWPYPPGLIKPTVAAPGVNTLSCRASPCNGYVYYSGTSMSAPHVAGAAALLLDADPQLGPAAVEQLLRETALDLGEPGMDNTYGAGRIDAFAAISQVACDRVKKLKAACKSDGTIKAVVKFADRGWDAHAVYLGIGEGFEATADVRGRKAKLKHCCLAGDQSVRLLAPQDCVAPVGVSCPD